MGNVRSSQKKRYKPAPVKEEEPVSPYFGQEDTRKKTNPVTPEVGAPLDLSDAKKTNSTDKVKQNTGNGRTLGEEPASPGIASNRSRITDRSGGPNDSCGSSRVVSVGSAKRRQDRVDRLLGPEDDPDTVSLAKDLEKVEEQIQVGISEARNRRVPSRKGKSPARVVAEVAQVESNQLGVAKGDVVDVLDSSMKQSGWIWCRNQQGDGWVPDAALEQDPCPDDTSTPSHPSKELVSKEESISHNQAVAQQDWTRKLKDTMVVHTMQNIVSLSQYTVDLLNPYGAATSLHIACWRGSIDAAEILTKNEPGLIQELHSVDGHLTPLHVGVICGYPEVVGFLLDQKANCNVATVHRLRPIHLAASTSLEITDLLLSAKAVVNARDEDDTTPLMFAACYHQQNIISSLLAAGAGVNLPNRWGVTPMHVLGAYGGIEGGIRSIQMVIAYKGDPWLADNTGLTALKVACKVSGNSCATAEFVKKYTNVDDLAAASKKVIVSVDEIEDGSPRFGADSGSARQKEVPDGEEAVKENSGLVKVKSAVVTQLHSKNAELQEQLRKLEKDMEEAVKAKNASDTQLTHAQERIESYQKMVKDSGETRAEDQKLQLQFMKEETSRLEKVCEAANKAREEMQGKHNEEIVQLKEKLAAELEMNVSTAEERLTVIKIAGQDEIKQLKQKIAELTEAKKSKDQNSSAQSKEQDKTIDKIKAELAEEKDAKIAAINEALAKKTAADKRDEERCEAVKNLESSLTQKTAECTEKITMCADLRKKIQDLVVQLSESKNVQDQTQTQAAESKMLLDNQLADKQSALDAKCEEMNIATKKLEELDSYKQKARYAEEMMAPLEERNKQLEEIFAQEQNLRKKYHNQLQDLKGAIRVYCRVRPKISREKEDAIGLRKVDAFTVELETTRGKDKTTQYVFDSIFDDTSSQEMVFTECVDLIQSALDGYNVTIFAYGQTGAGKTHTMYGSEEQPGLVPRTTAELFRVIDRDKGKSKFKVRMYMVELYCNDLDDLLLPKKGKSANLEIKRDHRGSVYVNNVTVVDVDSPQKIDEMMQSGFKRRHIAATKMNSESSRSHLIMSILIDAHNPSTKVEWCGKITLCDLAGSERLKKSEATGEQLKEAVSINKSLTALGDVIEALTSNAKHVPYRNHKLTELMSDSLGGNAKTLMFVNCSPAASNSVESASSLGYATRAKQITNQVSKQVDNKEVARLKQVIAEMSKQTKNKDTAPMPDSGQLKQALGL
eukprot:GEMP01001253.1.p1 GENE.GEMP01001253.1~~GEMP01001253.1.p1  ORF type:complete len:1239 (+),score=318.32 GEMP01001253.1:36-3752(+)